MAKTLKDCLRANGNIKERLDEERRRDAALWLYIVKRGLMDDFTEFYESHRKHSPYELEKLLMEEYRNILFGNNVADDEDF